MKLWNEKKMVDIMKNKGKIRHLLPENPRECRAMIKPAVRPTVHQNCYLCDDLLACYKHDKITPYVEQKILEITKAI